MSAQSFTLPSDATIVAPMQIGKRMPIPPMGTWKYLKTNSPPANWQTLAFDDSGWSSGPAPFGDNTSPCTLPEAIGTVWDGSTDILLRFRFYWPVVESIDHIIAGFSGAEAVDGGGIGFEYWNDGQSDFLAAGFSFLNCPVFVPSNPAANPPNTIQGGSGTAPTIAGANLFAVRMVGNGTKTFFDMTVWSVFDPPLTSDAVIVAPKTLTLISNAYIVGDKVVILLSDAVIGSPAVDFTLISDAVIVAPTTFTLTSDAVIRRPPLAPGQQNLFSKYLQQQRDALLEKTCTTCAPIDCVDNELGYSLESPEFPTVFVCPEGFDCTLIGEDFHLICCDGTLYDLHFSPQVSQEDRKRVVDSAIAECARKLAFCNINPCPTPPCNQIWLYWNNAIDCTAKCTSSEGGTFKWTVPARTYMAFSQIAADQAAGKAACQLANQHRLCFLGLQSATCIGETYSDDVIISGRFVAAYPNSDTISIVDALPDGLTFNDGSSFVTGGRAPIRGTPTVAGTFTFTVRITLGTLNDGYGDTQSKTFTIKVAQVKPDTLPDALIGTAYSQTLTVLPDHDDTTEEWSLVTSLPAGLTLDPDGFIRGTPAGPSESHNVTVRVSFILDGEQTFCTKQWTLTVNPNTVTPDIFSNAQSCWGTYSAGTYRVSYVNGALNYSNNQSLWQVGNLLYTRYNIRHDNGATNTGFSELTEGTYASQALAEAANAGKTHDIVHTGGTICMWFDDDPYTDNHPGNPNPTFRLTRIA